MIWQDMVITLVYVVFTMALVPQVYEGFRLRKGVISNATSIPTFVGLFVITYAFYTLGLYFSTIMSIVTGVLWLILFIQRLMYGKR